VLILIARMCWPPSIVAKFDKLSAAAVGALQWLCMARHTQGIPQLEPAIMDQLFWPSVPLLTAVHLQEEVTVQARGTMSACLAAALQPLHRQAASTISLICFLLANLIFC